LSLVEHEEQHDVTTFNGRQPSLRILLVDDSLINRRMASKLLKRSNNAFQDIDEAGDGQQALEKVLFSLRRRHGTQKAQGSSGNRENHLATLPALSEIARTSLPEEQADEEKQSKVEDDGEKQSQVRDDDKKQSQVREVAEDNGTKNSMEEEEQRHPVYFAILMDSVMPVMDGPTAVQRIREAGYTGLIVGVTGNVQPEDIEHFISCGADTVMGKPLDTDKLFGLLMEAKDAAQHNLLLPMSESSSHKKKVRNNC
jgi:CheY-like chemotaxis protein